jgi:hypothetical protein
MTQFENTGYIASGLGIDGNQTFVVQFADRDMKGPGVSSYLPEAIQAQTDTFADADTCGPHEQQRIGIQVVGATELLLQEPIVLRRKRSGQIPGRWREVLRTDEIRRNGVAVGSQIAEHPAKAEQIAAAGLVGQRRLMFAEMAEPGKQVGIAAELGESGQTRESSVEPGKESAGNAAIISHAVASQSQSESTEVRFKDLIET